MAFSLPSSTYVFGILWPRIGICPGLRTLLIGRRILLVEVRNVRDKGVVRIGICQKTFNTQKNLGNRQSRRPFILQNIKANRTRCVNIRMIDPRDKAHVWGAKGIVLREFNREFEDTAFIGRIRWAKNEAVPFIHIISLRSSATGGWRISLKFFQFILYAFQCHPYLQRCIILKLRGRPRKYPLL